MHFYCILWLAFASFFHLFPAISCFSSRVSPPIHRPLALSPFRLFVMAAVTASHIWTLSTNHGMLVRAPSILSVGGCPWKYCCAEARTKPVENRPRSRLRSNILGPRRQVTTAADRQGYANIHVGVILPLPLVSPYLGPAVAIVDRIIPHTACAEQTTTLPRQPVCQKLRK